MTCISEPQKQKPVRHFQMYMTGDYQNRLLYCCHSLMMVGWKTFHFQVPKYIYKYIRLLQVQLRNKKGKVKPCFFMLSSHQPKNICTLVPLVFQQWTLHHQQFQMHHHLSLLTAFPLQTLLFDEKLILKDKAYLPPARIILIIRQVFFSVN